MLPVIFVSGERGKSWNKQDISIITWLHCLVLLWDPLPLACTLSSESTKLLGPQTTSLTVFLAQPCYHPIQRPGRPQQDWKQYPLITSPFPTKEIRGHIRPQMSSWPRTWRESVGKQCSTPSRFIYSGWHGVQLRNRPLQTHLPYSFLHC